MLVPDNITSLEELEPNVVAAGDVEVDDSGIYPSLLDDDPVDTSGKAILEKPINKLSHQCQSSPSWWR